MHYASLHLCVNDEIESQIDEQRIEYFGGSQGSSVVRGFEVEEYHLTSSDHYKVVALNHYPGESSDSIRGNVADSAVPIIPAYDVAQTIDTDSSYKRVTTSSQPEASRRRA